MLQVRIDTANFTSALNRYAQMTGKGMSDVVKEQAKLLAKRLSDLTPPKTAAQGKKRVAIDIGKVYLRNEWFENVFQFTNKSLGDRVKDAVKHKDRQDLEAIFAKSQRLQKLHVEPFDKNRHRQARKGGRVFYKSPYSFPLADQRKVKQLTDEIRKKVGRAKSGWADCYKQLGGSAAGWLSQSNGTVVDQSQTANPQITLTNNVRYFSAVDARSNIVARAMQGRSTDMIKAAHNALQRAKNNSGVHP